MGLYRVIEGYLYDYRATWGYMGRSGKGIGSDRVHCNTAGRQSPLRSLAPRSLPGVSHFRGLVDPPYTLALKGDPILGNIGV